MENKMNEEQSYTVHKTDNQSLAPNRLTQILRWVGALLLGSAALAFMIQGYGGMDSMGRYYSFLGFSGFLTVCGVIAVTKLADPKGARTFVGVASAILPVLFLQLGALIYSLTLSQKLQMSDYFLYVAPSTASVIIAGLISTIVFIGVAYTGFSSFIRNSAVPATVGYLALNTLILIPTRDPQYVALISIISIVIMFLVDRKIKKNDNTWENKVTRAMLFAAPLLILIRSCSLLVYVPSPLLFCLLFGLISFILFYTISSFSEKKSARICCQIVSLPFVFLSMVALSESLTTSYGFDYIIFLSFTLFSLTLILMSFFAHYDGVIYRSLGILSGTFGVYYGFITFSEPTIAFYGIVFGIVVTVVSFIHQEKINFYGGTLLTGLSAVFFVSNAYYVVLLNPWASLAVLGVVIVFISSYIEKNTSVVLALIKRTRMQFEPTITSGETE